MKISEAAQFLGISSETIRYYEKEGIIKFRRDQNGYRTLNNEDLLALLSCIYNRQLGFSIKESATFEKGIPVETLISLLNKKITGLEREINQKRNLAERLKKIMQDAQTDYYNIDHFWITIEEERYLLPYAEIDNDGITFTQNDSSYYSLLFSYMPFIDMVQAFPSSLLEEEHSLTKWSFLIPHSIYLELPEELRKQAIKIPQLYCLNSVAINDHYDHPDDQLFVPVIKYIHTHSLHPTSLITASFPSSYFMSHGQKKRYAKILVPLEMDQNKSELI